MSNAPYDRAVQGFEALLHASANAVHAKPVRLIKDSGQHLTSGYRHTAALEAEGFLRRDEGGVYLQGAAALRTALSGFGFGRLAPVLPPVLRRLREETQHTAFFAMLDTLDVHMGPYSAGRATRQISIDPVYRHDLLRGLPAGQPSEALLVPHGTDAGNRLYALMIPVLPKDRFTAALGFVLNPARAPNPALGEAIVQAARQITP